MTSPRTGLIVAMAAAVLSGGCAGIRSGFSSSPSELDSENRVLRAVIDLEREAYERAENDLLLLVSDCASGEHGREALLLLAAAHLDTGNPNGSPRTAAYLAASYLLLPDASPTHLPLARSLYRLGTDLEPTDSPDVERMVPPVARRFDTCEDVTPPPTRRALPATPAPTTEKIAMLRGELSEYADSLHAQEAELAARSVRIAELGAEIERIAALLKSGLPGYTPSGRR